MSNAAVIGFVGILVGVLLIVIALIVWQEAKRRPSYEPLEYVIEDAVRHVATGLESEGKTHLTRADIRRVIEWEVFYLQGLAQKRRRDQVETIAGGHLASVSFIVGEIERAHGVSYPAGDVEDVLRYEADYLARIGAVGEPVELTGGEEE